MYRGYGGPTPGRSRVAGAGVQPAAGRAMPSKRQEYQAGSHAAAVPRPRYRVAPEQVQKEHT